LEVDLREGSRTDCGDADGGEVWSADDFEGLSGGGECGVSKARGAALAPPLIHMCRPSLNFRSIAG
jgi:hypothetical protein